MTRREALLLSAAVILNTPYFAFAQTASGKATVNQVDRVKTDQISKAQKQLQCEKNCDGIGRTMSISCGQFGLQGAGTCNLNVSKQTAACYQTCLK